MLDTPLSMVLGHERCGAVTAAVKGESLPGQISTFVKAIKTTSVDLKNKSDDVVENAVVTNIQYQVEKTKQNSDLLSQLILESKLKIVGGRSILILKK